MQEQKGIPLSGSDGCPHPFQGHIRSPEEVLFKSIR